MRVIRRPRKYIARHWLFMLRPLLRYSKSRNAYVLLGVGKSVGPVLRPDRRSQRRQIDGVDRRGRATTA